MCFVCVDLSMRTLQILSQFQIYQWQQRQQNLRPHTIGSFISTMASDNQNGSSSSGRGSAEAVCTLPSSSFTERYDAVRTYIDSLAKPVGSLGLLEDWAARVAALQKTTRPSLEGNKAICCIIFAADHGAAKDPAEGGEGCSAFPQAVTRSVLVGLERGIAGASVLAKCQNVPVSVVDVGIVGPNFEGTIVQSSPDKLSGGTQNMCLQPAMSMEEAERCINVGRTAAADAIQKGCRVLVLGEVGIGNTTASSALIAQLSTASVKDVCGGGARAGHAADQTIVQKKIDIVEKALKLHEQTMVSAKDALACVGGAEIAALVGSMLEASERDVPVLVDGFIATAAALVAANISPLSTQVMFLTTKSAEEGQSAAISAVQMVATENQLLPPQDPALNMSLRMGEGTAALLAVPILQSAIAMLTSMGTIEDILSG